jgi:uncharacterized protein YjbI with pentapeptide repeats
MMDASKLKEKQRKHSMWLNKEPGGEKADLRWANLSEANLSEANLSEANLSEADLSWADLRGANLRGSNLSEANLSWADLRWANLSEADLSEANLSEADLSWADLRGSNLREADLSGAQGAFVTGYYGKHHAVAAGGYIFIGCERHTYQEWLDNGEQIGKDNEYTDAEIEDYMDWIRLAIRALERMERE